MQGVGADVSAIGGGSGHKHKPFSGTGVDFVECFPDQLFKLIWLQSFNCRHFDVAEEGQGIAVLLPYFAQ